VLEIAEESEARLVRPLQILDDDEEGHILGQALCDAQEPVEESQPGESLVGIAGRRLAPSR
jgi:hypothetical protein